MRKKNFLACALPALGFGLVLAVVACGPAATHTPTPAPAAGAVLQKILNDCWGLAQMQDLDGTRADHVKGFECARKRLLDMARTYPDAAEPHRVLAWGYLYALKDETVAQAEYERAAEIYAQQGRKADQADMLMRIAVQMAMKQDPRRGCALLTQAADPDPQNARLMTLLQNFNCVPRATSAATPSPSVFITPISPGPTPTALIP